jgi:hypothetical protein
VQRFVAVAAAVSAAGCNDAILVKVASDRPPGAIDAFCLGVADSSLHGGQFGRAYRLEGKIATLPQTLRVEAGDADSALAWVRGDRGGVPVARAEAKIDFGSDVTLGMDRCARAPSSAPQMRGAAMGPPAARLAASVGAGGTLVVAVAPGMSAVLDGRSGGLAVAEAPAPPAGNPVAIVAADLDGDCDDDIVIATDGAPPELWLRDLGVFTDAGPIGTTGATALAAGDVDRDGDIDLIIASGASVRLLLNDGGVLGNPVSLPNGGRVVAASALAMGDLDGDGNPDLVAGQAGQPLVAWVGGPTGTFAAADAAVPPVPLDVESLALADADGDFDPDLVVAVRGAPPRLYIDRDGLLEDQTFVRLPPMLPNAHALAVGTWDNGCEPDLAIAGDAAPTLRGQETGKFVAEMPAPTATDVILADIDDNGVLDALMATADGVVWLAR